MQVRDCLNFNWSLKEILKITTNSPDSFQDSWYKPYFSCFRNFIIEWIYWFSVKLKSNSFGVLCYQA